jgi:uncharacterized protein YdaU (DUF1376 family)
MELICYCWREGWIPADSSAIAQLTGCHDLAIVEPCLSLFISHPDDPCKLIHKRLDAERKKQSEYSNERSESGKKGAETRWGKGKAAKKPADGKANSSANSSAIEEPIAKNSSSSSSSSSEEETTTTRQSGIPTLDQVTDYGQSVPMPVKKETAVAFFDTMEAGGWVTRQGHPIADWRAAFRRYATVWNEREKSGENVGGRSGKPSQPTHRQDQPGHYPGKPSLK